MRKLIICIAKIFFDKESNLRNNEFLVYVVLENIISSLFFYDEEPTAEILWIRKG